MDGESDDWRAHWTPRADVSVSDARLCDRCGDGVQYLRQTGRLAVAIEAGTWPPYRPHQCNPLGVAAIRAQDGLQAAATALMAFTEGMTQRQRPPVPMQSAAEHNNTNTSETSARPPLRVVPPQPQQSHGEPRGGLEL